MLAQVLCSNKKFLFVVAGDSGVGKSSIFLRYTKNQFDYTYKPTMSVCIETVVKPCPLSSHQHSGVGNHATTQHSKKPPQAVVVSLWDLPGKDEVDLRKVYYKNLDGVIGVSVSASMCVCVYLYVYACLCICMCVCVFYCLSVFVYILCECMHVLALYVCLHIHIPLPVCVCIVYTCMYYELFSCSGAGS